MITRWVICIVRLLMVPAAAGHVSGARLDRRYRPSILDWLIASTSPCLRSHEERCWRVRRGMMTIIVWTILKKKGGIRSSTYLVDFLPKKGAFWTTSSKEVTWGRPVIRREANRLVFWQPLCCTSTRRGASAQQATVVVYCTLYWTLPDFQPSLEMFSSRSLVDKMSWPITRMLACMYVVAMSPHGSWWSVVPLSWLLSHECT